jgi:hypothetical protein
VIESGVRYREIGMSIDETKRYHGLGWPCAHCTATGVEPFTSTVSSGGPWKCFKGCDDGFVKLIGYHDDKDLPVKCGDRVRIRKGTLIKTIYHGERLAGRTYTVRVDHLLNGMKAHKDYHGQELPAEPPKVRWPGPGGYWSEADINDVELVSE